MRTVSGNNAPRVDLHWEARGGIHDTAHSGEQDTPSEDICQGIEVVGAGHSLQSAQEKLAAIFAHP